MRKLVAFIAILALAVSVMTAQKTDKNNVMFAQSIKIDSTMTQVTTEKVARDIYPNGIVISKMEFDEINNYMISREYNPVYAVEKFYGTNGIMTQTALTIDNKGDTVYKFVSFNCNINEEEMEINPYKTFLEKELEIRDMINKEQTMNNRNNQELNSKRIAFFTHMINFWDKLYK